MKKVSLVLAALLLSSCVETAPREVLHAPQFAGIAPIALNVSKIEMRDDYKPPMVPPNVDHQFPAVPDAVVRDLLDHALSADGVAGNLRVIIADASVVSVKIPQDQSMLARIKDVPSERYEARVAVRFERFEPAAPDIITGHAEVVATRNATLMNSYSPADRERVAAELTATLMKDVEAGLRSVVKDTFGRK